MVSGRVFFRGLLAGSLIGAVASMVFAPQMMGGSRKMMGRTRKMQHKASRVYQEVRDGVSQLVKR